ncbi:MAG: CHASE2 domain-containing protein, partial [Desulfovibrionaceae bacterium]|nr:CHASE2 domain-containing protein [Desulfovibrionaceae bacterium]
MRLFRINAEKNWAALPAILTGFLLTAVMLFAYIGRPSLLTHLDLKAYDLLLPLRAAAEPSPVPVIIDLDEASIAEHGQWPWPRYLLADILGALTEYGVAAIGLDIIFAEEDRTSPERVREALRRDKGLDFAYSGIPPDFHDFDQVFALALKNSPTVLGAYASFTEEVGETPSPATGVVVRLKEPGAVPWPTLMPEAQSALLPIPALRGGAPLGFVNAGVGLDGIMREIPLVLRIGEDIHPSLSLRTLMRGFGLRNFTLEAGLYGLEAVRLGGGLTIPISPEGMLRIPFIGPGRTYPYYSAADVLARRVPVEALQGHVAFVSSSLMGLDLRATPFDQAYPGVETHAAALDVMLTGNSISLPPWTPAAQVGLILFAGLASTLSFSFARPRVYLPVAAALMGALVILVRRLFSQGLFLSPL